MRNPASGPDPRVVPTLRFAFLIGAGLLGAVVGFLRNQGAPPPTEVTEVAAALTLGGRIVWAVAIAACLVLAAQIRKDRNPQKQLALSIIGWAFAEATAIFGAAYWFLLGSSQWYFAGLGFLALALLALPGVHRGS